MKKNTIWITGAAGRIGKELVKALSNNNENKVIATDIDVDITNHDEVMSYVQLNRPNVIINCASLSNEQFCEENRLEAYKVNALGARNLAIASHHVHAKIIHLSTDDVFSGKHEGLLNEFDYADPISVYGKSKLAGENYVRELNSKHLIVRSSWVYGKKGSDFLNKVLEHGKNNEEFEVPFNEVSTPTSTKELSDFIVKLVDTSEYGIYHASCLGTCTRYEYAKKILELSGYNVDLVKGVTLSKTHSTLLENMMMEITGIHVMKDWQDAMKEHFGG